MGCQIMTTKGIHLIGFGAKHPRLSHDTMHNVTAYLLMALCYLFIGITLYLFWEKANHG